MSEVFDTNILIDHLNGIAKASRELQQASVPAISVVTWIEVMTGAASAGEEAILRAFLANFQVLEITREVAERSVLNRRQKRLKMPDAIILATAEAAGRLLVTRNVKDFPVGMSGIRVPYKL